MTDQTSPRQPPVSTRFKKGQSGNPKGRPKKNKETGSAFDIVIEMTLTLNQGGVPREVTVEEALQHQTYKDAIAGNRPARREILKMIAKREAYLVAQAEKRGFKITIREEPGDPNDADEALQVLGIAKPDPRREDMSADDGTPLLLEPWAVQAALRRRRGGKKLLQQDIDNIKRCTRRR